jgi:hypothetical protein
MQTIIATTPVNINIPIEFLFWGFIFVYIIHILEESTLPEVFVEKVKKNFWPEYSWKHFFGFNTTLLVLNITAVLLFDFLRGSWLIFPLSLAIERTLNGLWHFGETIITKKYSSGLLASVATWTLFYFIVRYSLLKGEISIQYFIISFIIGLMITILMFGSSFIFKARYKNKKGSKLPNRI